MNIHEEHWNTDKSGKLLGIWDIDASQASGVDLWQKLDVVIAEYARVHPDLMRLHIIETKQAASTAANDLAMSKGGSLRWGASIPPGLFFKLQEVEPALFEDKKLFNQFLRKFPGFRICKKV